MLLERKQDLSLFYYVQSLFSAYPQITIVDEFPEQLLTLPTVSVEAKTIDTYPIQLGSFRRVRLRFWTINVFAQNKSQRDEMAYTLISSLEDVFPVYDYDLGFPPTVVPQIGAMDVDQLSLDLIRIDPRTTTKLYYRSVVSLSAFYNQI